MSTAVSCAFINACEVLTSDTVSFTMMTLCHSGKYPEDQMYPEYQINPKDQRDQKARGHPEDQMDQMD